MACELSQGRAIGQAILSKPVWPCAIQTGDRRAAFDNVGVELDAAVVEEKREPFPVVQAVTVLLGDRRLGGDASELLLEPSLERCDHPGALCGVRRRSRHGFHREIWQFRTLHNLLYK